MNAPKDLKYTKNHEWIRIEGDTAVQGITDYAQSELSDIAFVELPDEGINVEKDNACGTIEAVKAVSEIYAAVSGGIIEVNSGIVDNPEIISDDPYGEGWLFKIKMSDPSEADELMSADQYISSIE
ncbi:MAG: glycine cleavage system protein GcvH [bacterium]